MEINKDYEKNSRANMVHWRQTLVSLWPSQISIKKRAKICLLNRQDASAFKITFVTASEAGPEIFVFPHGDKAKINPEV